MNLRELRETSGKSRKEIAQKLNIPYSTYSNYEQGIRKISLEQVLILAKLFDVTTEEIIIAQLSSCQCDQ